MELRHLRYFAAVVDAGGISKAATRLRVTQPALGRQIRNLERELGIRLFDRVGRRIRITADGEDLLRRCRTLLTDAESIVERSRALTSGVAGVLRIGATPQTIESLLVPFMPGFQRTHPGVELQVVEDGGPRLLGHVERGEVHLALTVAGDSRFASRSLFPAVAMAVMSNRHPLARQRTVDIPTLGTVPLLLLRREFGTRQWLEGACQAQRVRPRIALESAAPEVIIALAGIGYGIGIVPSTVIVRGPGFHLAPVMHGSAVLGGWFTASWHPRRFFPRFGETFIDALESFARKSYPGRAIVARAPLPSREPLPVDIMR